MREQFEYQQNGQEHVQKPPAPTGGHLQDVSYYAASPYADIINLPHHVSGKHPHMSMEARAAQFAPFAALSEFGEED